MSLRKARYSAAASPNVLDGWSIDWLTPPSRLFGANGLRTGLDGRIYVAQVTGSQISAVDPRSGEVEAISPKGGDIVSPDDLAFDPRGNLYATEVMEGRVSVRSPDGRTRVLRADLPCANGITVHQGRLFINECRIGGRLMELDLDGGAPRVLLENLPMPNAMEVGPDGLLYFPIMATGEICRINLEGGAPETVAKDLIYPDAVKFDPKGNIVTTQAATGEVTSIDPRSGKKTKLAQLAPGLDNCTFVGDRLFVSNFTGEITEIAGDGSVKTLLAGGLNWPLDLTVSDDGSLYVADGTNLFVLPPGGKLQTVGMMFTPGYPGVVRGLHALGGGVFITTNTNGQVHRYKPASMENEVLAQGLDQQLYGVAVAQNGAVVIAELGAGRVSSIGAGGKVEALATGLRDPMGVAFAPDGACLVSECGGGRVVKLTRPGTYETFVDGLQQPQGMLVYDGSLYVVDAGAEAVVCVDLKSKARTTIAGNLPIGAMPGVTPKPLRGMPSFTGPQGPFAGIAAGKDGTIFVSGDGEGSVLALRRKGRA